MTIYLYKKTHNITGMQYLGKTIKDPFRYKGSGKDWVKHLQQHGHDVTTDVIKECSTKEELSRWGRYYSALWNIVESENWANKIPETGGGPGAKDHKGNKNPMYGKCRDDMSGDRSPNKTPERRLDTSICFKKLWADPEYRKRASLVRKNHWKNAEYVEKMNNRKRTVKRVSIKGEIYDSLREAASGLKIDPSTVSKRCSSLSSCFSDWFYID